MTGRQVRPVGAVDIRTLRRLVTPAVAWVVAAAPRIEVEPEGDLELDRFFDDLEEEFERDRERERQRRLVEDLEREAEEQRRRAEEEERQREGEDRARREDAKREGRLRALDPMEPY
ncbi:hypothetical protein KBX53_34725, partial [Micromonospora sp. M51]